MIKCSIGIIVHNEAANIGKLLDSLLKQKLDRVQIMEIIVVSSASTDQTDRIVGEYCQKNKQITLITEPERRGKSSAINLFLDKASSEILIIESGDTIPAPDTVERMIAPFSDSSVGMTGGRPVPENKPDSFVGYSVNLLWNLHHKMAMISPKLGEMVAFRKVFKEIPANSAVDEASIEAIIRDQGYTLRYIPEAIVHNKGPENLSDFIKQRRRIASGHIWLQETSDYQVTSQSKKILLFLFWNELKAHPRLFFYLLGVVFIEIYSRFLGWYDFKLKGKNPYKWEIAETTKNLKNQ